MIPSVRELRFRCPHCSGKLSGVESLAGAIVPCAHCGKPTFVPLLPPAAPPPPSGMAPDFISVELKLRCPACQAKLRVDARAAGQTVPCPECRGALTIPPLPPYPELLPTTPDGASIREVRMKDFPLSLEEIDFLMAPVAVAETEQEPDDHP